MYSFLERGEGRRKRGRETSMCGCLSHAPYWGPDPQPRHVPWLGIEPEPFVLQSGHLIHINPQSHTSQSKLTALLIHIFKCLFEIGMPRSLGVKRWWPWLVVIKIVFLYNCHPQCWILYLQFFNPYLGICLLISEGGHQSVASLTWPNQELGSCPDQGSDPQSFDVGDNTPANWATCQGCICIVLKSIYI